MSIKSKMTELSTNDNFKHYVFESRQGANHLSDQLGLKGNAVVEAFESFQERLIDTKYPQFKGQEDLVANTLFFIESGLLNDHTEDEIEKMYETFISTSEEPKVKFFLMCMAIARNYFAKNGSRLSGRERSEGLAVETLELLNSEKFLPIKPDVIFRNELFAGTIQKFIECMQMIDAISFLNDKLNAVQVFDELIHEIGTENRLVDVALETVLKRVDEKVKEGIQIIMKAKQ